jgi:hypothetical protein
MGVRGVDLNAYIDSGLSERVSLGKIAELYGWQKSTQDNVDTYAQPNGLRVVLTWAYDTLAQVVRGTDASDITATASNHFSSPELCKVAELFLRDTE